MKNKTTEIKWEKPEPFSLMAESATDGDRVAREIARRETDKQTTEKQQRKLI